MRSVAQPGEAAKAVRDLTASFHSPTVTALHALGPDRCGAMQAWLLQAPGAGVPENETPAVVS
jgi:hypothetical protein